ncbi:MAG: NosD domain-containing protein [Acidilobus sp.]
MGRVRCLVVLLVLALATPYLSHIISPGSAAGNQDAQVNYITSCTNITSPGYYELASNLTGYQTTHYCIGVFSSNVVLDGGGHALNGAPPRGPMGLEGIYVGEASGNVTIDNVIVENYYYDVYTAGDAVMVKDVTAKGGMYGFYILGNYSTLQSIAASTYMDGVYVGGFGDVVEAATLNGNYYFGVYLAGRGDVVRNSNFIDDGLFLSFKASYLLPNYTVVNDTVNGRPLVYIYNESNVSVRYAGEVIAIDSANLALVGLNLSNSSVGAELLNVNSSRVVNVTATGIYYGYGFYVVGNYNLFKNDTGGAARDVTDVVGFLVIGNYNTIEDSRTSWDQTGLNVSGNDNLIREVSADMNMNGVLLNGNYNFLSNLSANSDNEGLYITGNYNTVENVTASYDYGGLKVSGNNNTIEDVRTNFNKDYGLKVSGSDNVVEGSYFIGDGDYAIVLFRSSGDLIYNNFFNDTRYIDLAPWVTIPWAFWNVSLKQGKNIIGGSVIGGNVWVSPNGTGFSQTCAPVPSEPEICDRPFNIGGNNTDYLPLRYVRAMSTTTSAATAQTSSTSPAPPVRARGPSALTAVVVASALIVTVVVVLALRRR